MDISATDSFAVFVSTPVLQTAHSRTNIHPELIMLRPWSASYSTKKKNTVVVSFSVLVLLLLNIVHGIVSELGVHDR